MPPRRVPDEPTPKQAVSERRRAAVDDEVPRPDARTGDRQLSRKSPDDFRARLRLDRNDLDTAAMEQPVLFEEITEQVALSISRRDLIKFDIEQAEASLDIQFRKAAGENKVTDKAIRAEVESSVKMIDLRKAFMEAESTVRRWQAMREAFEQRRDMIKVSAQLYAAGYFTRSSVNGARNTMDDKRADEIRRAAGEERGSRMKE